MNFRTLTAENEQEIRELLDIENKDWVIYQSFNDWKEKPFDLNANDVEQILNDIRKPYVFEQHRPWVQLGEDGMVAVIYPNVCRMLSRERKGR